MADVLEPGVVIKPCMDKNIAINWAQKIYGLKAINVKEFNSYDDRNYYFHVDPDADIGNEHLRKSDISPDGYILKVTNILDSKDPDFTEAQNKMILHMANADLAVPIPIKNKNGGLMSYEEIEVEKKGNDWASNNESIDGPTKVNKHLVRLLKFIPGNFGHAIQIRFWGYTHTK